jgi:anaerobic ribonucleoside-triphosphate reductase activating protein
MQLNLHATLARSRANGPGTRFVLWTQGCARRCAGCFNPATHSHAPHQLISVDALFHQIIAEVPAIDGISLSGGEPLEQADAIYRLLTRVRNETALSTLLFTGYTLGEIQANPTFAPVLTHLDVLIAGPYDASQPLTSRLLGSANQQIHRLTDRYTHDQIAQVPSSEVHITPDGQVIISGIRRVDRKM